MVTMTTTTPPMLPHAPRYSRVSNGQRQVSRYADPYGSWLTIERLLDALGISGRRLGIFLGISEPDQHVYHWKSGRHSPSSLNFQRMLELLLDFHEGNLDIKNFDPEAKWNGKQGSPGKDTP